MLSTNAFRQDAYTKKYERCVYSTSRESKADDKEEDTDAPVKAIIRKKRAVILSDDEDEGLSPPVTKKQLSSPRHSHATDEGQCS